MKANTSNPPEVLELNLISIDFPFMLSGALRAKSENSRLRWLSTIFNQSPLFIFQFQLNGFLINRSSCFFRASKRILVTTILIRV